MKRSILVITFDEHDLPVIRGKATKEQMIAASNLLNHESRKKVRHKRNKVIHFFKCLYKAAQTEKPKRYYPKQTAEICPVLEVI